MTSPIGLTLRPLGTRCPEVYATLVNQTPDAITSAGFTDAVVGLSGGIDSALVATIAVDALGADHVHGILMPSPYSSEGSVTDATELADRLGIETHVVPITAAYETFNEMLSLSFEGLERDVTEENLQARIRGVILMAFSNKFGYYVLATGNKSEAYAGYATLYGDMVGAWAPLAPLYKTYVYEIARYRNSLSEQAPIPEPILTKEPSAELSFGQLDKHALGEYHELDPVLYQLVDNRRSVEQVIALGFDQGSVENVSELVRRSAFKRGFAAPGPHLS